jgi:hypothetical protein
MSSMWVDQSTPIIINSSLIVKVIEARPLTINIKVPRLVKVSSPKRVYYMRSQKRAMNSKKTRN